MAARGESGSDWSESDGENDDEAEEDEDDKDEDVDGGGEKRWRFSWLIGGKIERSLLLGREECLMITIDGNWGLQGLISSASFWCLGLSSITIVSGAKKKKKKKE